MSRDVSTTSNAPLSLPVGRVYRTKRKRRPGKRKPPFINEVRSTWLMVARHHKWCRRPMVLNQGYKLTFTWRQGPSYRWRELSLVDCAAAHSEGHLYSFLRQLMRGHDVA